MKRPYVPRRLAGGRRNRTARDTLSVRRRLSHVARCVSGRSRLPSRATASIKIVSAAARTDKHEVLDTFGESSRCMETKLRRAASFKTMKGRRLLVQQAIRRANGSDVHLRGQGPRGYGSAAHGLPACESRDAGSAPPFRF